MSDIIERLRAAGSYEAASEIQRLRDRVEGLTAVIHMVDGIMVRYKRAFETDEA